MNRVIDFLMRVLMILIGVIGVLLGCTFLYWFVSRQMWNDFPK